MSDIHIRWMIRRDMVEVCRIESASFDDPWTNAEFVRCLRQRNCIGLVAEDCDSQEVLGFVVYELKPHRLEILNLAVDPVRRCEGVGEAMVAKLKSKLMPRRPTISALIRETNLAAQLFFQRRGFRWVLTARHEYGNEDAYWLEYEQDTDPPIAVAVSRLRSTVSRGLRWSS